MATIELVIIHAHTCRQRKGRGQTPFIFQEQGVLTHRGIHACAIRISVIAIGLQLATGYTVAYLVYTIGTLVTGGVLDIGAAIGGLVAVLAMAAVIAGLIANTNKKLKKEYALKNR